MPLTIGIAGSGVAGLTAALMLARQGHRVTIHEQAENLGPVGAGVLLQPSGQAVLQAMNLLAPVVAQAERIERLVAFTHRGKTLIDLPYGELGTGACAFGLQRGELFAALYQAAINAGVTIRTAERMTGYQRQGDGVYFAQSLSPGESAKLRHGPYNFVLAADGARSSIRENSTINKHAVAYPHGALWAVAPCQKVAGYLLQLCRGTRELCGVLPTGRGRASLFWSVRNDAKDRLKQRGFAPWRDDVLALCPQSAEMFEGPQGIASFDAVQFVSYMRVRMDPPFDDACLFLGDAAHAMSPHLGQGINLALIDGYTFAQALAATGNFAAACQFHRRQRSAHIRAYSLITYLLSPFFQSRGIIKGWGRDLALPLMPKLPPLRRRMIRTMAGCSATLLGGTWKL